MGVSKLTVALSGFVIATIALPVRLTGQSDKSEVVYEYRGPGYLRRALLVGQAVFEMPELERRSQELLTDCRSQRIVIVRMAGDRDFLNLGKLLPTHTAALNAEAVAGALRDRSFDFAEVVCIGSDAVLRFRNRAGDSTKVVLQGRDPLRVETPIGSGDIVWIEYFREGPEPIAFESGEAEDVAVHVVTPQPTVEFAKAAFEQVRVKLPHARLHLWASSQAWLPLVEWFPLLNPFDWPTKDELKRMFAVPQSTFTCQQAAGVETCSVISR